MSEHLDRHVIRGLAREHFLNEWQEDGWQVDYTCGEVCVGDSWFAVESLPRILSNHMAGLHDAQQEVKARHMEAEKVVRLREALGLNIPTQGREEASGCVNVECPMTMAACERHCSTCGSAFDAAPCSQNPITGEGGHTRGTGLPEDDA